MIPPKRLEQSSGPEDARVDLEQEIAGTSWNSTRACSGAGCSCGVGTEAGAREPSDGAEGTGEEVSSIVQGTEEHLHIRESRHVFWYRSLVRSLLSFGFSGY